jgi:hypothetical protein
MMPPPMMTTRAWVGKFAITPSCVDGPRIARRIEQQEMAKA